MWYSDAMTPKKGDPIDGHVGARLKLRRNMMGWSQEKLGQAIGVSFQMVQKYERGSCRVGASRLMKIANALNVPVSWFFEGGSASMSGAHLRVAEDKLTLDDDMLQSKETLELLKAYYALNENMRKHVLGMIKAMEEQKEDK